MSALLFLHGLATPGIILAEHPGETTPLLAFAGGATLPAGGAILALAAWPAVLRVAAGGGGVARAPDIHPHPSDF
jgi:hypothetical protein